VRIAVTGARGQLAQSLRRTLSSTDHELILVSHEQLDICDRAALRDFLGTVRPDVLVNTAAYIRVDDCETEIDRCLRVNAGGAAALADACAERDVWLVHFSTDYVFDGAQSEPYQESDVPRPLNMYGASKLAGEHAIRAIHDRSTIVRTCGLYGRGGATGKGGNFVTVMLGLGRQGRPLRVVDDQVLTPTATDDLATWVAWLLEHERHGLLHLTNAGQCSWYEFAREIFRQSGLAVDLSPIDSATYGARARRPAYSVLAHDRFVAAGGPRPRDWHEALAEYVRILDT
jgi:dTDP-4-dehydrorhamnose reductase